MIATLGSSASHPIFLNIEIHSPLFNSPLPSVSTTSITEPITHGGATPHSSKPSLISKGSKTPLPSLSNFVKSIPGVIPTSDIFIAIILKRASESTPLAAVALARVNNAAIWCELRCSFASLIASCPLSLFAKAAPPAPAAPLTARVVA